MKKISFDTGVEEFFIRGGGVLRFNPTDPNVYARFLEAAEKLPEIESGLTQRAQGMEAAPTGEAAVQLMQDADRRIKALLNGVLGGDNDLDKALGGVNLLALAGNGKPVVTNLFAALEEILSAGAERFAADTARAIREEA